MKKSRWVALLAALFMVLAACSGDAASDDDGDTGDTGETTTTTQAPATTTTQASGDTGSDDGGDDDMMDLAGTTVTVFGPESSENEAGAMQDALDIFAAETGIEIVYTGARDFSDQINAQAAGGNPPDIAIFPQPGKVRDFGVQGFLLPVPQDVVDEHVGTWPDGTYAAVTLAGSVWAVPNKSDLKSMVWYNVEGFNAGGYAIPETWQELLDLTDQMIADGVTPWCVGIESGPATGWTFTDWMEDLMLRYHGGDVYDQWINHEIPFDDDRVVQVGQEILNLWNTPGAVFAAGGTIAATAFSANGEPLANGDCVLHRQASFFPAFFPEGTSVGAGQDIDWFYFPVVNDQFTPVLTAGTYAGAFRDAPEVWAVMKFLSSPEYSTERQKAQAARVNPDGGTANSGYLSANLEQDTQYYNDFELSLVETLQSANLARFDGSDLMPAAVGAGTFWTEGTSVVNGDKSVADGFAAIEASWP